MAGQIIEDKYHIEEAISEYFKEYDWNDALPEFEECVSGIWQIGKDDRQVLILCESESHHYSKLIGECYHFQETGEVLDFGEVKVNGAIITGSLLEYFHRVWKLIDIKDELKAHKNKELIKNEVNQDGYIRIVTDGYL